ncbi:hypothetical protein PU560_09395, partial [Georgenia sp. 10Sc9-8]|nr:hypothetical protein [Georgenia halotolerans]
MPTSIDDLVAAVRELDPQGRSKRWTSLSYCVLDAVWSINADYSSVVDPLVRRIASELGDDAPVAPVDQMPSEDPAPLTALVATYPDESALLAVANRQRTSTTNGVTKAEAALSYARILIDHDVTTLADAEALTPGGDQFEAVDSALRTVPGEGSHGIRRGYFWMLVGDDNGVKPDRMVLRWLKRHGFEGGASDALSVIRTVAARLS